MKNLIKTYSMLLVFTSLALISCSDKRDNNQSEDEKWDNIRNNYQSVILDYKRKYNVINDWSKLEYKYTIQYEPILKDGGYQIISRPFFHDFFIKNDTCYASVFSQYYTYSQFQFKLSMSQNVFQKIENTLLREDRQNWSFIIVKINELIKTDNMIEVVVDKEYDVITSRKPETFFIGTGELIDFYQADLKQ